MIHHSEATQHEIFVLLRNNTVQFAGNKRLKIYGYLHCKSGKRMNRKNRVFFANEIEAISHGFRPCGHCMKERYKAYKIKSNR